MTIEQTLKLSIPFYRDKMSIDYDSRLENKPGSTLALFGVTGEFWKI